jgi:hypothetical protein
MAAEKLNYDLIIITNDYWTTEPIHFYKYYDDYVI